MMQSEIIIKDSKQIANIRKSGKYLTELLYKIRDAAKAGIKLIELEFIAEDFVKKNNVKGAFK
jgi:methionine aminopeptidase